MKLHAWKSVDDAKRQWAGQLVGRALQNDAPCAFAREVIECLVGTIGALATVEAVLNFGWGHLENLVNGLVLLKVLERVVGEENVELRDRVSGLIENERAKAGVANGFRTEEEITRFLCQ
jgi:hypothetical protein